MRKAILAIFAIATLFSTAYAEPKEPNIQIDTLVKRLQAGKIDGAFSDFFRVA